MKQTFDINEPPWPLSYLLKVTIQLIRIPFERARNFVLGTSEGNGTVSWLAEARASLVESTTRVQRLPMCVP